MSSQDQRFSAIVTGRVQGVNFRAATHRTAVRLGVRGWVRNCSDGSVEVAAEGPRSALDDLIRFLHRGPPSAIVDEVRVKWISAMGHESEFAIRW